MFWKDQFAFDILRFSDPVTADWLFTQISVYPSLRVKTLDAKGKIPVIQFNGRGEWLKPKEWAINHVANLKQHYLELQQRLNDMDCDPVRMIMSSVGSEPTDSASQSDPSELHKLQANYDRLSKSYIKAIDELESIFQGNEMSLSVQEAVARMIRTGNYIYI